jgi:hypothetical protein
MVCVASTLHSTLEHGVSSITAADAHTSAASSRLNWRPRRFKWTRPFRRKTKSRFWRVPSHFKRSLRTHAKHKCRTVKQPNIYGYFKTVTQSTFPTVDSLYTIRPIKLQSVIYNDLVTFCLHVWTYKGSPSGRYKKANSYSKFCQRCACVVKI